MTTDGMELFGRIVAANVAQASATTDSLLAYKDEQVVRLARALAELGNVLDRATVIDRKTERALSRFEVDFDYAVDLLSRVDGAS